MDDTERSPSGTPETIPMKRPTRVDEDPTIKKKSNKGLTAKYKCPAVVAVISFIAGGIMLIVGGVDKDISQVGRVCLFALGALCVVAPIMFAIYIGCCNKESQQNNGNNSGNEEKQSLNKTEFTQNQYDSII